MELSGQDSVDDFKRAMKRLIAQSIEAFNQGDAAACANLYVDDAIVLLPDRAPVKGRKAIQAHLDEHMKAGAKLSSIDPIEMNASADLGYCIGTYRFEMSPADVSSTDETGKFVTVLKRQADGTWKAVVDSLIRDTHID